MGVKLIQMKGGCGHMGVKLIQMKGGCGQIVSDVRMGCMKKIEKYRELMPSLEGEEPENP